MINKEFFAALEDLEREKGISSEVFLETLRNAVGFAYKRQTGIASKIVMETDPEKGSIRFFSVKTVVEDVEDEENEIWILDAQEENPNAKIGDVITKEFIPKDVGRIAAQTAKQVIMQKLREAERDNTLSAFSDKEDELMTCLVRRVENGNVYVDLGQGEMEGVMLPQDQTRGEEYHVNDKLKVYVKRVKSMGRNAQVLVSRSCAGLVKRLFENEVPEIRQGYVEVKAVAREAGERTKIAIYAEDSRIDPVGACVGNKGARVNAVVAELGREKIDIILWNENPLEFIAKALSPAKVQRVIMLSEQQKAARVVVADDVLSLAIGRNGQNARLAARLTGWKIDVKSESYMLEHEAELAEKDLEKYGVDIEVPVEEDGNLEI